MKTADNIRKSTNFFCVVGIIGSILLGASFCFEKKWYTGGKLEFAEGSEIFTGILIMVIGIAFCTALTYIGHGISEMLSNSCEIYEKTARTLNPLGGNGVSSENSFPAYTGNVSSQSSIVSGSGIKETVEPAVISEDIIECPKCAFQQRSGRRICFNCGVSFRQ